TLREAIEKVVAPLQERALEAREWLLTLYAALAWRPGHELDWYEVRPRLERLFGALLPDHPAQVELLLGQFQQSLDGAGMQAQMEELLAPWNAELQRRISAAEGVLAHACSQDEQEARLECQISVVEQGAAAFQDQVLGWLVKLEGKEVGDLRAALG